MLISNTVQRVNYLTFIIILCAIPLSCFSQDFDLSDPISLKAKMMETLPVKNRIIDDPESFEELYDDLQIAEINTIRDLDTLIENQLPRVLEIEKEICKQISKSGELTANVPSGIYSAEPKDVPMIKEGIYFTIVGLVRSMIDLTHLSKEDEDALEI